MKRECHRWSKKMNKKGTRDKLLSATSFRVKRITNSRWKVQSRKRSLSNKSQWVPTRDISIKKWKQRKTRTNGWIQLPGVQKKSMRKRWRTNTKHLPSRSRSSTRNSLLERKSLNFNNGTRGLRTESAKNGTYNLSKPSNNLTTTSFSNQSSKSNCSLKTEWPRVKVTRT